MVGKPPANAAMAMAMTLGFLIFGFAAEKAWWLCCLWR